jgi:hypothetical protein
VGYLAACALALAVLVPYWVLARLLWGEDAAGEPPWELAHRGW